MKENESWYEMVGILTLHCQLYNTVCSMKMILNIKYNFNTK